MAPNEWRTETEADTGRERYVCELSVGFFLMVYQTDHQPEGWKGVIQRPSREKWDFFPDRDQAKQWCIGEARKILFDDMGKLDRLRAEIADAKGTLSKAMSTA